MKAIEILEPLASHGSAGPEPRRALRALVRCWRISWCAAVPTKIGLNRFTARPWKLSKHSRRPSGDHRRSPSPGSDLEEPGRPPAAQWSIVPGKDSYNAAIATFNQANGAEPKQNSEIKKRSRWQPTPAAGFTANRVISRGRNKITVKPSTLLESLVADFPTVPRYRESLAQHAIAWP